MLQPLEDGEVAPSKLCLMCPNHALGCSPSGGDWPLGVGSRYAQDWRHPVQLGAVLLGPKQGHRPEPAGAGMDPTESYPMLWLCSVRAAGLSKGYIALGY